ncbi:MAG: ABC transporter permease [Dehalococcoidia bacterium]
MIRLVVTLTLRELVVQRRSLLLVAFALLPVLLASIFRIAGIDETPQRFATDLLVFIVHLVLPLTALVLGTAALGTEFEDGTAVYLLSKPIPRWKVFAGKLIAAWGATAVVVCSAALVTGTIVLAGERQEGIIPAFTVAAAAGSLAYVALFVALTTVTGRALIIGLVYVFVWEAIFSNFAPGTQLFSVREYTLGIAELLASTPAHTFDAELGPYQSTLMLAGVFATATALGIDRLASYEIGVSG